MQTHPPVLLALANLFKSSNIGTSGWKSAHYTCDFRKLLQSANAHDGEPRVLAEQHLRLAEKSSARLLTLDVHPRDPSLTHRIRLHGHPAETWLFQHLQQTSPTRLREALAAAFTTAAASPNIPPHWKPQWQTWCETLATRSITGEAIPPFHRLDPALNAELLKTLPAILSWPGESLLRFASCVLCGNSKRLEQLQNRLEQALQQITQDTTTTLQSFGLLDQPRTVTLHGPLQLHTPAGLLDLTHLTGPITLSEADVRHALHLETSAPRILSIENQATFLEFAKLRSGTLLIHTSYPGRAVRELYARLPAEIPCHHFGDSDPAGFDILRDLREKTARSIAPLHMAHRPRSHPSSTPEPFTAEDIRCLDRLIAHPLMQDLHSTLRHLREAPDKGDYEQESLGPPSPAWPHHPTSQPNR